VGAENQRVSLKKGGGDRTLTKGRTGGVLVGPIFKKKKTPEHTRLERKKTPSYGAPYLEEKKKKKVKHGTEKMNNTRPKGGWPRWRQLVRSKKEKKGEERLRTAGGRGERRRDAPKSCPSLDGTDVPCFPKRGKK